MKYNDKEDWRNNKDTLDFDSTNPKIMTYHSAKGLQFEAVFLPFIEKFEEIKKKIGTPDTSKLTGGFAVQVKDIALCAGPRIDGNVAALHGVVGHGVHAAGGNRGLRAGAGGGGDRHQGDDIAGDLSAALIIGDAAPSGDDILGNGKRKIIHFNLPL